MSAPDYKKVFRFRDESPELGARVFLHEQSHVSGAVTLGDDVSIWPMAVIRGDVNRVVLGARTNVQDGSVLHVTHEGPWAPEGMPLLIGDDVTIGHNATLHGCTIGHRCLVGMGAIVMDGAVLESDCMIAAGAVVTPGTRVPSRTLWRGNPAREARSLSDREVENLLYGAAHYVRLKNLAMGEPV